MFRYVLTQFLNWSKIIIGLTILGGGGLLVFIRGFYMGFSPFWPYQVRPQWGNHALLTINLNDLRKQENNRRGVQSAIDVGWSRFSELVRAHVVSAITEADSRVLSCTPNLPIPRHVVSTIAFTAASLAANCRSSRNAGVLRRVILRRVEGLAVDW